MLLTLGAVVLDGAALETLLTFGRSRCSTRRTAQPSGRYQRSAVMLDGAALGVLSTLGAIVLGAALGALGAVTLDGAALEPTARMLDGLEVAAPVRHGEGPSAVYAPSDLAYSRLCYRTTRKNNSALSRKV